MLLLDFETRSRVNLLTAGAYTYAQDVSTDILCCAFTLADPEDEREWLWYPAHGKLPAELRHLLQTEDYIGAHNAPFDRLIYECVAEADYGWPKIDFDRWYCTSAQMRVNNLPASLEDAARALDTKHKKNPRGATLIRLLSIPDKVTDEFNEDPDLMVEMGEYCLDDIRTTKGLVNATRLMSRREHEDWLNNEDINERGVLIDTHLAEAAQRYANDEYIEIAAELSRASHGAITKHTQTVRAAGWVAERLGEDHPALKMMRRYKNDEPKLSLDKEARSDIIDAYETEQIEVPDDVLDVVVALHEGSKSSVTKFKNMALRADPYTKRVYGCFIYAGASQTLRFASRGLQMHNMPSRGLFKTMDEAWSMYDHLMAGRPVAEFDAELPTMDALKKMLRHAIKPADDKWLVIGDWSSVEARILPWLSDSPGGDEKLDLIEDIDEAKARGEAIRDLYQRTADDLRMPERRDVGKVTELACGYEGGLGAFKVFAKAYGVVLPEYEMKQIIKRWRANNPWVVQFWRDLEDAAIKAIRNPGMTAKAGLIRYLYAPTLIEGTLLCILPDDSVIQFPKARIEYDNRQRAQITALKASIKMKADAKEWPRESLYGGRLAGIATQGTAGALLRDLLARLDDTVAHVHDEVILEVDEDAADDTAALLKREMETAPAWAEGLPLKADPCVAERYMK